MQEQVFSDLLDVFRRLKALIREEGARHGINPSHFGTLRVLQKSGPSTMGELAERLVLSHGAMTGIVDRLFSLGLVTRNHSESDRRVVQVLLTPEAEAIQAEMQARAREQIASIFGLLEASEQVEAARGIRLFTEALKKHEGQNLERSPQDGK
ncbi:MAG TPA: MarR family transcriptional regulator [Chroococcales cyanobacterium]